MKGFGCILRWFAAALCGAAALSCAKSVVDSASFGKPVEFSGISVETKAVLDEDYFVPGDAVGVSAYHVPNGSKVMYNQSVSYDGTLWTYSPLAYWPQSEGSSVDFYSYSPYFDGNGTTGVKVAVPAAGEKPSFTFVLNEAADVDLMAAVRKGHRYEDGPVPLQFEHLLGKLQFKFAVSEEGGFSYIVNTIKVRKTPKEAKYVWDTGQFSVISTTSVVAESGTYGEGHLVNSVEPVLIEDFTMYLIPEVLGEIEVVVNNEEPQCLDLSEVDIESGKVVTITMEIGLSGVMFTTSVGNWVSGGTVSGNIS